MKSQSQRNLWTRLVLNLVLLLPGILSATMVPAQVRTGQLLYDKLAKTQRDYQAAMATGDRGTSELYLTTAGYNRIYPGKPYRAIVISLNLGKLVSYLSTGFYPLSRSIVINLAYLDRIESNQLYIGSQDILISDGARKLLMDRLQVVRKR